jgi:hypothetical protein
VPGKSSILFVTLRLDLGGFAVWNPVDMTPDTSNNLQDLPLQLRAVKGFGDGTHPKTRHFHRSLQLADYLDRRRFSRRRFER